MNSTLATSLKSANILPSAFADQSTLKNSIPATPSGAANRASFSQGFPAQTMQPVAGGGIPPSGYDVNGILYQITTLQYLQQFGYNLNEFNTTQSAAGYPKGAVVIYPSGNATNKSIYVALVDGTQALPTAASDWVQLFATPSLSNITTQPVQSSGTVNMSPDVVVESYISSSGTQWYRKCKSGWINQGGIFVNTASTEALGTVPFTLQFPTTCLDVKINRLNSTSQTASGVVWSSVNNITTSGFDAYFGNASRTIMWSAMGY